MIRLCSGLEKSFLVLELLRNDEDLQGVNVDVECFQNGREMGLTFTVWQGATRITYCVYEHRNSDQIIVNHKKGWSSFTGDLPYKGESKYEYDQAFRYDEHYKCYEYLKEQLIAHAEKV